MMSKDNASQLLQELYGLEVDARMAARVGAALRGACQFVVEARTRDGWRLDSFRDDSNDE